MLQETIMVQDFWPKLQHALKERFGEAIFQMWFSQLECMESTDNRLVISVPHDFAKIWIEDNYLEFIQKEVSSHAPQALIVELRVVSQPTSDATEDETQPAAAAEETPDSTNRRGNSRSRFRTSGTSLNGINPRNTFSNFVVGSNSQFAHAACIAVANAPGAAYNPLFLYGDSGLGKTHLMHAVAHWIGEKNPEANILYISCEQFTNEYIKAIQENTTHRFRNRYRNVDVLLIDDVHFLSGKERIQEEFFHTFNELFDNQKQILLTSDRPVSEIVKLENRLVSRFQMGLVADIQAPDVETRMAILRKKANSMKFSLSDDILQFIAERVSRNVRRMEGALIRVGGYAALVGKPVTLATVQSLLTDTLQEEALDQVTIDKIQGRVADYYKLKTSDMSSKRRPNHIALPRQIAMYLCRKLTRHSLQEIGEAFGGRHHGTVIHACENIDNLMNQDPHYRREIEFLVNQLSKDPSHS
jgi:chromosomal replication initiator protein